VSNAGSNNITIWPNGNGAAGNNSRIEFPATTVINVDSIGTYSAAFNGGGVQTTFYPGANVFVRAQISDPFGSFDIGSARITHHRSGQRHAGEQPAHDGAGRAGHLQFERARPPASFSTSTPCRPRRRSAAWTVRITANEGTRARSRISASAVSPSPFRSRRSPSSRPRRCSRTP
jgi:hypothetical protein